MYVKGLMAALMLFAPLWPMDLEPFPGEPFIMVNKATHELGWAENGELQDVYDVATGKDAEATPEGIFAVSVKAKEPYYRAQDIEGGDADNPLGSRWIGFDAAASDGRTYGIHGTNDDSSIGENVSLGCVRMHNEEVNELYDQVPIGTKVWIGTEPEKEMADIAADNGVL
ncbi:L,D-transpeptidase [Natribacillus halophilus]|uniref:L,D-transpeptidase catalytic domain n=1 Tax=Natribacillus halophilus TaxID=549003 RepID=A0A1G8JID3_9BACI|nr:L,D-transpeptidase [Natribacillus halophilus]SDI30777.1 L,D-transpeptidase catalytic domain [Natribacillus halophilus]